jgi:hypothetical protein
MKFKHMIMPFKEHNHKKQTKKDDYSNLLQRRLLIINDKS